eukprot:162361_1
MMLSSIGCSTNTPQTLDQQKFDEDLQKNMPPFLTKVTMVFVVVPGYGKLFELFDDDTMKEIMEGFYEKIPLSIAEAGGYVVETSGPTVYAVFKNSLEAANWAYEAHEIKWHLEFGTFKRRETVPESAPSMEQITGRAVLGELFSAKL